MSDRPKDLRKLCILNAKEADTDDMFRSMCERFGHVINIHRAPQKPNLVFVHFQAESEAENAKAYITGKGYSVGFAHLNDQRKRRDEFRSRQSLNHGSENGAESMEADSTNQNDNRPYGICIRCGEKAYHNCGRCGDFYCSEECQTSDWLTHKRNCFPMPKLIPSKSIHNLHASRANIAKSVEKIRISENGNGNLDDIDAADGHLKTPPQKVQPPSPHVSPAVTPDVKPASSQDSNEHSVADKSSKVKVEIREGSEIQSISSRQKIILLSNGGDSPRSNPVATNGIVSESIQNDAEVYITHVKNHSTVYIRAAAASTEYAKLLTEVEEASKTAQKLKVYPARGDLVMAPFDGGYYRAFVVGCNESSGTVRVGYIDFGNSQEVPFSSLKVLPTELKERHRFTIMVLLKNMKEDADPNEKAAMKLHLEELSEVGKGALLKVHGDNSEINAKDQVELFNVISNQSINEELNAMTQKRFRISDLTQKIVNGSNYHLMGIGTERIHENIMTCILKEDVTAFMAGDESTQAYGHSVKNAPAYKPKEKELCVVKVKEQEGTVWYRCIYQQELVDDRAQVYCIDYGKIINVRANNIRAMAENVNHEITSFVCRIANGDSLTPDVKTKLLESFECKPKSIEFNGDTHVITLDV